MGKILHLRLFQFLLIILISGSIGYFIGQKKVEVGWKEYKPILSVSSKEPPIGTDLDMALFYQTLDKVSSEYYDKSKINSRKILYGAISGMLSSLDDPYTSFFPPKENTNFKQVLAGEFQGIGAELGMSSENIIMVVSPLDGSPAQKGGIKSGDLILKVEDNETRGWTLAQAVEKIRGPKGTSVTLTILHSDEGKTKELKIIRDVIQIDSIRSWVKDISCNKEKCAEKSCPTCSSVGYIRVSQFGDKTNNEWIKAVNTIAKDIESQNNFKGIILDVRSNPGGYLHDAVFIASEFLENEAVVVMQESNTGELVKMNVARKGLLTKVPIVVLINKGSASASEILAGALRDHKRAKLIGENSFGKGTIQEAVEIGNGASVHISVAKWLTPNGTWVNKVGLKPDIEVKFDEKSATNAANFDNQIQRAIRELTK